MAAEIWKDIEGFEGYYQISSEGRARSLDRIVKKNTHIKGKQLTLSHDRRGYPQIFLSKDNIRTHRSIHRLVASAFILNPYNKPEVNHIDGVKSNNDYRNLEWMTSSENAIHAISLGLKIPPICPFIGKFGKDNPKSKEILQLNMMGELIAEFGSQHEAQRETKINNAHISEACNNIRRSAGGFIWRFKVA